MEVVEMTRHRNTEPNPQQMKTNEHHQLCALLAASLVFITAASPLHGAVNTFTDAGAWETTALEGRRAQSAYEP